jgi:hypothetical protein
MSEIKTPKMQKPSTCQCKFTTLTCSSYKSELSVYTIKQKYDPEAELTD